MIMSSDLNFHIGDKVVYPNHGVGVIEQISSRSIGLTRRNEDHFLGRSSFTLILCHFPS